MKKNKLLILGLITLLVGLFIKFDLGQFLTLEFIKSQQQWAQDYYSKNTALTLGTFSLIYIISTAMSLPGATVLTLASGAFFGVLVGTAVVSISSTIGATLAFLASRFFFKDVVQSRFGSQLRDINEGVKREGGFYLFTLRLIPYVPFFVINLVMGLTPIPVLKYFFVSMVGMFPGTVVYVNAGTQIAQLRDLSGILSPPMIVSFTLLGVFPLIAKKALSFYKSRKILSPYRVPDQFDYNVIAIGGGSAGLVSSYIAAVVKAKVALIEKHKMGGDCLNTGCIPSKALIRSAKMMAYAARAKEFGFKSTTIDYDFAEVMERVQNVIKKVEPHDSVERYSSLGVDCYEAEAKILTPFEVEVNGKDGKKVLTTRNIIIATGARPLVPPIPGLDKTGFYTSDTIWNLRTLPKRLLVLGGGPIGSELAQCFHRLGAKVTQVEQSPRILIREDDDSADFVINKFKKEGVTILTEHTAKAFEVSIDSEGETIKTMIAEKAGGGETRVVFDEVLVALGRKANTAGFGAEDLGISLSEKGTFESDPFLRTNFPNIYVCGDVAGPYQFTHTAAHQAWYAAVNALFSPFKEFKADYRVIPWATFTDPEVARVGINEKEAKEKGIPHEVTIYGIDDLDRAIADNEDHGQVKVITAPGKDKILGVTIVGHHAGDLISEFVLAMKYNIGLNKILGTIHIYPTLAESNKYVAGEWKKAHTPTRLLAWVEKFHRWRRS